jgi:hypothetical protein
MNHSTFEMLCLLFLYVFDAKAISKKIFLKFIILSFLFVDLVKNFKRMSKATQIEWSKLIRVKLYNLGVFLVKLIAWTWFKVCQKNN